MSGEEVWRRDEIESPCVKLCVMDQGTGLCRGCFRSLDEIAAWGSLAPEARRRIMAELPSRAPRLAPRRRGGRAGRLAGKGPERPGEE